MSDRYLCEQEMPPQLLQRVEGYERALINNDVKALSAFFADDPDGVPVLRIDTEGILQGHDQIANFRKHRTSPPKRTLKRRYCCTLSEHAAAVVSTFDKSTGGVIYQTQVWRSVLGQWQIVVAHLTYPEPAVDSRIWRVVGSPLFRGQLQSDLTAHTLQGLSVAVKDLFAVKGYAIGAGNPIFLNEGSPQTEHSWAVQRLLDAGADVKGISRTDEFAYSLSGTNAHYGTPPNQQAPGCISGGSSSGSASATALGQVDIGLGTDTGGSVRVPSSYQYLWGIRTTHDAIPKQGLLPLAQSFDTVGFMTRDCHTLQRVAQVLLPNSSLIPLSGRVIWSDELIDTASEDVAASIHKWIDNIQDSRETHLPMVLKQHSTEEILGKTAFNEPDRLSDMLNVYKVIQGFEAWQHHGDWISKHYDTLGEDVASRFAVASKITYEQYRAAYAQMNFWRKEFRRVLDRDVVLLPTASSAAPELNISSAGSQTIEKVRTATMKLTSIAGLCGLPAINVPLRNSDGKPCGVSVIGPAGSDIELIIFAGKLNESAKQSTCAHDLREHHD
jgi:Asp-tRNA(Asn)/Glu-tRNA(Gln) amidotransferase A subunit family amidase